MHLIRTLLRAWPALPLATTALLLAATAPSGAAPSVPPASRGLGSANASLPSGQASTNASPATLDYRLQVGDRISITLIAEPNPVTTPVDGLAIPPGGRIAFYNVSVVAAGRTLAELEADLTVGIKRLIRNPSLTVNLVSSPYSIVTVNGSVEKPGELPYRPGMNVFEALSKAGGLTKGAAKSAFIYRRVGESKPETLPVDLAALVSGDLSQALPLQPGDILVINDALIFVDGKVKTPGKLDLRAADTVAKAVSAAGGLTADADLDHAFIRRGDKTITVNLRSLHDAGNDSAAADLPLAAGDLLVIPGLSSRVMIMGDVNTAGTYFLVPGEGDKLLDMISKAGGATRTADLTRVQVRRDALGPKATAMELSAGPGAKPSDNVILLDGDVVYVPTKKEKSKTDRLFAASILTQIFTALRSTLK